MLIRLTASLTAHGNEVHQAEDGNSAIREFTTWNPDAMILDLGLPDQDGLDVLRTIRVTRTCGSDTPS